MKKMNNDEPFTPRLVRLKDAPKYLSIGKNLFNEKVRPLLTEIRITDRIVSFDIQELDLWAESQLHSASRLGSKQSCEELEIWKKEKKGTVPGWKKETASGGSTKVFKANAFESAVGRLTKKRRKKS
jgi:hypothetical protein